MDTILKQPKKRQSRLDLIDNNLLTSFPLAHPLPDSEIKKIGGENTRFVSDYTIRTSTDKTHEIPDSKLNTISNGTLAHTHNASTSNYEPLVLVEDYFDECDNLKSFNKKTGFKKRISVLDFKETLKKRHESSTSSGTDTLSRPSVSTYSKISSCSSASSKPEPYVQSVIQSHPDMAKECGKLKYCVICDRPLYEISNLIPIDKDFKELVCGDCFAKYEKIWKSLKQISNEDKDDDETLEHSSLMLLLGSESYTTAMSDTTGEYTTSLVTDYNNNSNEGNEYNNFDTLLRISTRTTDNNDSLEMEYDETRSTGNSSVVASIERSILIRNLVSRLREIKRRDDNARSTIISHKSSIVSLFNTANRRQYEDRCERSDMLSRLRAGFIQYAYS